MSQDTLVSQDGTVAAPLPQDAQPLPITVMPAGYFRWKYALGRVIALVLLVPGLPLMAICMIAVRLTSRGPAIFKQARVGRDGRTFVMYKIRSLIQDAEKRTGPVWSTAGDPRVTRVGRVLRKLHLDELPQLFNVIKGEMALVGPRPERPEIVPVLSRRVPGYLNRLAVRPGITGLAQVNLPPDSDLDSVRRKLALDTQYIASATFLLDVRMLLCTLVRIVGVPGRWAVAITGLKRNAAVSEAFDGEAAYAGNGDAQLADAERRFLATMGAPRGSASSRGRETPRRKAPTTPATAAAAASGDAFRKRSPK